MYVLLAFLLAATLPAGVAWQLQKSLLSSANGLKRSVALSTMNPSRREVLGASAAAAASAVTPPFLSASAFCGDAYNPEWVFRLSFNEGEVPLTTSSGDKVGMFVRVVGDDRKQKASKVRPLLVIPGGPGLPHDYLETIEAVAKTDRQVLEFDPLGTGQSAFPGANARSSSSENGDSAARTSRLVAAVANPAAVAEQATAAANVAFGKGVCHHILGHGTGAAAALLYAASNPDAVASLTLASPIFGAAPQVTFPWRGDDPLLRGVFDRPNLPVKSGSDAGQPDRRAALFPICLEDAAVAGNGDIYAAWQAVTPGALEEAAKAIGPRGIPTLLSSGAKDFEGVASSLPAATELLRSISASAPSTTDTVAQQQASTSKAASTSKKARQNSFIPGCENSVAVITFAVSGHMAHLDERETFLAGLFTFLDASDSELKLQ